MLFMVFDSAVMQSTTQWPFRWPVPSPGDEMPSYLIQGETWDELAKNIDARLDKLRGRASVTGRIGPDVKLADTFVQHLGQTIERFNGFASAGKDDDFQRGEAPIEKAWGGPPREGNTGNSQMFTFKDTGPYYAVGGTLDTKGGPVIDTGARVLHVSGRAIPGLYGAGNCISSPAGQAYWSGGGTIGPAITYGYIAGKNAAAESERSVD